MSTKEIVKAYIRQNHLSGDEVPIGDDDLLGGGLIDSLGIIQLISFVEEQFNFEIPDEDVTIENFRTLKAIVDYIESAMA